MDPGQVLRTVRRLYNYSQREFAERVGVAKSTIDRIEAGRTMPRLDTFAAMLAEIGVHLVLTDRAGLVIPIDIDDERLRDALDRHFPAHMELEPITSGESPWWGWNRIAWSIDDPAVPAYTYWRRHRRRPAAPPI